MYDAVVVGAGPAGGMAARSLAAAGFQTAILEKKKVVGEPVQCAEGLSEFGLASNGLHPRDEWVVQRVSGAKCIVPNGTWFYITRLPGYAISRPTFDRWLVDGAVDDGAELRTSTKVTGISHHDGVWRVQANGKTIESRILIGADGPASFVARQAGLVRSLERIGAYEYRFRREDVPLLDPDFFLLYIGEAYNGGYAWIFPKGDSVNVGAGGHIDAHAATVDFCRKFGIDVDRKTQTIAGSIPSRYDLTALAAPGLAIAGDAAGITNPLNGAGIHPGIFSGRIAGEFAVAALEREDPTSMMAYDRAMKASPFLDPLLFWMIDRIRRWGDRLMNSVGEELDGLDWRAVNRRTVDACNVTDGQRALVRISSLAAATIALQEGVEPIMQMVSRDRNRIGLQSDLLGAAALGIHNVLCLWGDPPPAGNEKDAKAVFDLSTEEMIATFRALRDTGTLRGGDQVEQAPKVFIGAAADPFRSSMEESFGKLRGMVTAGADFVQTQGVYDVDAFEEWMRFVRKEWLHDKVYILAGVIPLKSAKMARFMVEKLGAVVPKHILERMEGAPNPKAEGVSIAVRTIKALKKIEGVRGVHIMPIGWEEIVPDLVREAGLLPRPEPTP